MENNKQEEKKTLPEPHVTVMGEEVGNNPEIGSREKARAGRCACGRYDRCRCCGGGFGGIIVILIGVLLILNSYGVVSWGIWNAMAAFWPALLIVIGVKILFGRNIVGRLITGLVALVLVAAILLIGLARIGSPLLANMHLPAEIMNLINQVK